MVAPKIPAAILLDEELLDLLLLTLLALLLLTATELLALLLLMVTELLALLLLMATELLALLLIAALLVLLLIALAELLVAALLELAMPLTVLIFLLMANVLLIVTTTVAELLTATKGAFELFMDEALERILMFSSVRLPTELLATLTVDFELVTIGAELATLVALLISIAAELCAVSWVAGRSLAAPPPHAVNMADTSIMPVTIFAHLKVKPSIYTPKYYWSLCCPNVSRQQRALSLSYCFSSSAGKRGGVIRIFVRLGI